MFIKATTIEGVEGDVEIARTDAGALVTHEYVTTGRFGAKRTTRIVCEVGRSEDRESRYAKARGVAAIVCGRTRDGEPNATTSMVHEVLEAIERVAGC